MNDFAKMRWEERKRFKKLQETLKLVTSSMDNHVKALATLVQMREALECELAQLRQKGAF